MTVGKLREIMSTASDKVVVALVAKSDSDELTRIQNVDAEYSGGPVLKLRVTSGRGEDETLRPRR